jgi:hypothetical protein
MTKTLLKQIIANQGKIVKIIAVVNNLQVTSGSIDEVNIDVLLNGVSILTSGTHVILTSVDYKTVVDISDVKVFPKDEVEVILDYDNGVSYDNVNVKVRCSSIA